MAGKAAVIGSGIGGGIAAMVLSAAGWQVVVFEKGVSHFTDLTAASPGTLYSKDELKSRRAFGLADSLVDPRTFRRSAAETNPRVVGLVKTLPTTVGGGTVFWTRRSPGSGASTSPSAARLGRSPAPTSPIGRSSTRSWHLGMTKPRPGCNDCGLCSGYGCPILARAGALAPLRRALRTGRVELRTETFIHRVERRATRATGVSYLDAGGRPGFEPADLIVLAASAVETTRLALLSEFPDPHGLLGRHGRPVRRRGRRAALPPVSGVAVIAP